MSTLNSSKIAPFHQIVAISQGTINTKFNYDWHYIPNASKFSITVPAGSTDPDYSVDATLNPPTVSLCAQNDPSQLVFSLNFKSGTFKYWTGHAPPVQHSVDMTGWIIAFVVNMGNSSIEQLPPAAQSKVLVPGQYGISQLLVDFTTAQLDQYMANLSNTPNLTAEGISSLNDCITQYLAGLTSQGGHILGYALTDTSGNNTTSPTAPPTAVKFQIIPCYDSNNNVEYGSDSNSIVFLEITSGTMPTDTLNWKGNVFPTEANGTMVVCKANFWDKYLVPQLAAYNRLILTHINSTIVWLWNGTNPQQNADWFITDTNPNSTTQAQSTFDNANNFETVASTSVPTYSWSFKSDWGPPLNPLGQMVADIATNITNTIVGGGSGTSTITINTDAEIQVNVTEYVTEGDIEVANQYNNQVSIKPSFTLSLVPGTDGMLQIVTTVSSGSITADCADGGTFSWYNKDPTANSDAMSSDLKSGLQSNAEVQDVINLLQKGLNAQNSFVFAGNNTFLFKTTTFNDEGDVLAGLYYND